MSTLDLGAVVTLRRELLENIDSKLASITKSDLEWPTCTQSEEQAAHLVIVSPLSRFDPRADEFDHQGKLDRKYWSLLQTRYLSEISEASWSEALKKLPNYWTVVSISLADTKDALFLSCGRARHQPIIFRIPIGRANRKENSDITGELSFETAKKELSDIIKSSAQNGKRAGQVADQGKSIRAEWWAERKNLDERLRTLLENIEFCWLGGFKVRCHSVSKWQFMNRSMTDYFQTTRHAPSKNSNKLLCPGLYYLQETCFRK
jgi:separase